ncbi:proteasome subunit beta [Naegleria gruberi]|uniref:Proteasome subunit beta n=1 Tax=Naegleria gruberi TaxID=5762 RepID=D2VBB3_NAEGR|nr:proteasome subunit beta [Naegleria gruberi]EFC45767.1 proteasome subunit beta [Naegleria gruberi]|eukprot:XP_002678511.1 proteasome subunit beta [Naegleria gruberi strain NEG-M]
MLCSDTLGSYGSLARFRSVERLRKVGNNTLIGASGEYSDFQYIVDLLEKLVDKDFCADDKIETQPKAIFQYLVRIMYNRRNKFNPLWNTLIVAGVKDGKSFLGYTDLLGSNFEDDTMASGYGAYLAKPILRKFLDEKGGDVNNITEQEAKDVLEKCMKVLYYRDARSINKIQIATANETGLNVTEPYSLQTEWAFKGF